MISKPGDDTATAYDEGLGQAIWERLRWRYGDTAEREWDDVRDLFVFVVVGPALRSARSKA